MYYQSQYKHLIVRITKWQNSCNADPSAPIFLPNVHCLMAKAWCKFEQNRTKAIKVINTLNVHRKYVLSVTIQSSYCKNYKVAYVTNWIKSCLLQCFGTFKMPILMFISILVFRPEGQIWNPVRRDTRIYIRRILNASRISRTQLNSCTISPS